MNYWLVKSEPSAYSWEDFVKENVGRWDGVRNYAARNNLMAMKKEDLVLFYHSNEGKEIVGIAKVVREHYPDPTAESDKGKWVAVDLTPVEKLPHGVTLQAIKTDSRLAAMVFLRQSRLSVSPLRKEEFDIIIAKPYDR